ncbi:DUF3105 domain-containing protein [Streptomyces sp. LBUM 1478]|uniref:DUF3105 domain-containing protein n=1 Tax=Streptomyces scabiei TaxID=1930 RepID=UPI000765EE20|nr:MULTISPECIES: DUF3105 domain-containing protein [Streptomyces]MBP5866921.1 DUF3105 domain-containing protein [Streptomyces sp. LBUM 1485]MBP5905553.1 DUF3105 domain-containing protein [Streptomyces sp. LBUM 1478]MBP5932044.1 DUF3105 domain-containing protein [Streptomyces sp. LBUM 1479]MBP5917316.1 DUF3105 domain-containing protein [Streptomyces sp. LBUM 1486]MDX3029099.1 DUF3105 domain-containing protein [Streptomyces scabiei]
MAAKTNSSGDRKARIEAMRRAERSRERRNRILTIGASVLVVAGLVVGGTVLIRSQSDDGDSVASDSKSTGKWKTGSDGVKTWSTKLTQNHVTKSVKYPMEPPVGGDHNPVWQNCNGDVYDKAIKNENAVHSLEHGAVWVTYSSKASEADVKALAEKVKKTPYTLMSPVEDQKDPIMLSAWGHQRTVTGAKDPDVAKFFESYVQGKQTPEPGAACTNGIS